jgi:hypothetical protein
MEKNSIVKSVQSNGTFEWQGKMFYKYEVQFENGDCGDYNSIKEQQDKFVQGQETKYIFDNSKPNYPKIKPVWEPKQSGGFTPARRDPGKELIIVKQVCLKVAAEVIAKPKASEIIKMAEVFKDWVIDDKQPAKTKSRETTDLPF